MEKTVRLLVTFALVTIMLLMISVAVAEGAEHDYHYAYCNEPDVCAIGGEPYSGENISHAVKAEWYDNTWHAYRCTRCGEVTDYDTHAAYCDALGVCYVCDEPYTGNNVRHGNYTVEHDADTHWAVCTACGEIALGPEEHRTDCQNPDTCEFCEALCTGNNVYHIGVATIEHDANTHWYECTTCGEIIWGPENHYFYCTDPEEFCSECGLAYPGDDDESEWYQYHAAHYAFDADEHWAECPDCGITFNYESHTPASDDPTVCEKCGAPLSASVTGVPNLDNPLGKLAIYDEAGELVDYTGFEKFEGADFYFEHGVIRDDMDYLTLISGTWYNMDHGRFNTGDGIVFFEGGTFLVKGGLIDETQTGLVTYDGQKFAFAHGQLQSNIYGAWCDPITGKFAYIWAGQFYPITDLVSYDWQVFYFINGYLATDFVGTVYDFNGTPFNIIYGQAY